jgi:hypothetical protein
MKWLRLWPGILPLLLALLVAACGSSSSGSQTPGPSPTNAPTAAPRPTATPVPYPTLRAGSDAAEGLRIAAPFTLARLREPTAASIESAVRSAFDSVPDGFQFGARGAADASHNGDIAAFVAVLRIPGTDVSSPEFLDGLAARISAGGKGTARVERIEGTELRIITEPEGRAEIVFSVGNRVVWCFGTTEELELRVARAILAANS